MTNEEIELSGGGLPGVQTNGRPTEQMTNFTCQFAECQQYKTNYVVPRQIRKFICQAAGAQEYNINNCEYSKWGH